jgi:hypothetical protein
VADDEHMARNLLERHSYGAQREKVLGIHTRTAGTKQIRCGERNHCTAACLFHGEAAGRFLRSQQHLEAIHARLSGSRRRL